MYIHNIDKLYFVRSFVLVLTRNSLGWENMCGRLSQAGTSRWGLCGSTLCPLALPGLLSGDSIAVVHGLELCVSIEVMMVGWLPLSFGTSTEILFVWTLRRGATGVCASFKSSQPSRTLANESSGGRVRSAAACSGCSGPTHHRSLQCW